MAKTCRNFQFKLRRSQIRENEVGSEYAMLKDELRAMRREERKRGAADRLREWLKKRYEICQ
jgi:hypothetical protein